MPTEASAQSGPSAGRRSAANVGRLVVWNTMIGLILLLLILLIVYSFVTWREYYGQLLVRYPLYLAIYLVLFGILSGASGRSFGLSNLFWHERAGSQLLAGIFLTLLLTTMASSSYEILHDTNGDQIFASFRNQRDEALKIFQWSQLVGPGMTAQTAAASFPVDVCEVNTGLNKRIALSRNYARFWFLAWNPPDPTQTRRPNAEAQSATFETFVKTAYQLAILPDFETSRSLYNRFLTETAARWPEVGPACRSAIAASNTIPAEPEWESDAANRLKTLAAIKGALSTSDDSFALSYLEDVAGEQTVENDEKADPEAFQAASIRAATTRSKIFLTGAVLPWIGMLTIPWLWRLIDPRFRDRLGRWLGIPSSKRESGKWGGVPLVAGLFGTFVAMILLAPWVVAGLTRAYLSTISPWFSGLVAQKELWGRATAEALGRIPVLGAVSGIVVGLTQAVERIDPEVWLEIIGVQLALLAILLILAVTLRNQRWVSSPVALCLMLMLFSQVYGLLVHLPVVLSPLLQFAWVVLFLVVFLIFNREPFKLRFPGMTTASGDLYDPANRVQLIPTNTTAAVDHAHKKLEVSDQAPPRRLLDSERILEAWKVAAKRDGGAPREPILVVVTTTGGSIRAAFWTAQVLAKLSAVPGFAPSVRLITGASGGMLGAGLYVALREGPSVPIKAGRSNLGQTAVRTLPRDSLSEVARRMALHDLPSLLRPGRSKTDRGQALEETWERSILAQLAADEPERGRSPVLFQSFQALAEGERQGWRPSLVFTPMMAEDGKRLLISNLDLHPLTENEVASLNTDLYSQSALQFFDLFPQADAFRLSTAIRMSATFPFISPAVSLPTNPHRRVVDAGYYDNYGVNTAAMWLEHHKSWIVKNTSGVLLIQVRAFPEARPATKENSLANGLSFLTTPLQAVLQARQSVMSYRNDELLELLSKWFQAETGTSDFFKNATFACSSSASLSWHLTELERDEILSCFEPLGGVLSELNLTDLGKLETWWKMRRQAGAPLAARHGANAAPEPTTATTTTESE